jgi:hypothetical protein
MRSLRDRFLGALPMAGMLLCISGLAAVSLEHVSFGHVHLALMHAVHHHHLNLGAHEHSDAPAVPGSEAPAPQEREAPRKTATLSVAPALFQPVTASVLTVPAVDSSPFVLVLALPRVAHPVVPPDRPRGPPASITAPSSRWEKRFPQLLTSGSAGDQESMAAPAVAWGVAARVAVSPFEERHGPRRAEHGGDGRRPPISKPPVTPQSLPLHGFDDHVEGR